MAGRPDLPPACLLGAGLMAKELGISPTTFRRWVNEGHFPPHDFLVSGERKWCGETLAKWRAEHP